MRVGMYIRVASGVASAVAMRRIQHRTAHQALAQIPAALLGSGGGQVRVQLAHTCAAQGGRARRRSLWAAPGGAPFERVCRVVSAGHEFERCCLVQWPPPFYSPLCTRIHAVTPEQRVRPVWPCTCSVSRSAQPFRVRLARETLRARAAVVYIAVCTGIRPAVNIEC